MSPGPCQAALGSLKLSRPARGVAFDRQHSQALVFPMPCAVSTLVQGTGDAISAYRRPALLRGKWVALRVGANR